MATQAGSPKGISPRAGLQQRQHSPTIRSRPGTAQTGAQPFTQRAQASTPMRGQSHARAMSPGCQPPCTMSLLPPAIAQVATPMRQQHPSLAYAAAAAVEVAGNQNARLAECQIRKADIVRTEHVLAQRKAEIDRAGSNLARAKAEVLEAENLILGGAQRRHSMYTPRCGPSRQSHGPMTGIHVATAAATVVTVGQARPLAPVAVGRALTSNAAPPLADLAREAMQPAASRAPPTAEVRNIFGGPRSAMTSPGSPLRQRRNMPTPRGVLNVTPRAMMLSPEGSYRPAMGSAVAPVGMSSGSYRPSWSTPAGSAVAPVVTSTGSATTNATVITTPGAASRQLATTYIAPAATLQVASTPRQASHVHVPVAMPFAPKVEKEPESEKQSPESLRSGGIHLGSEDAQSNALGASIRLVEPECSCPPGGEEENIAPPAKERSYCPSEAPSENHSNLILTYESIPKLSRTDAGYKKEFGYNAEKVVFENQPKLPTADARAGAGPRTPRAALEPSTFENCPSVSKADVHHNKFMNA